MRIHTDALSALHVDRRAVFKGAAASTLTVALGAGSVAAQQSGGTLVVGHVTLRHLNPAIQSGNATGVPAAQIFAGLVQFDDKWQPQPYLAASWEASPDKLTYTFKLNDKATFHDGRPVTSEDVAFSVGIVKANHPFGAPMFGAVAEVQTPDPKTAVFKLAYPHPALLIACSTITLPILPKHVFGDAPIQTHPANVAPIGAGPFKFKEYTPGESVVLERYDGFAAIRPNRPMLARLVFRIIKDPLANMLALERGDVQYAPFSLVRVRDIARIQGNSKLAMTTKGYEANGATNYLEFNFRRPFLGDVRVRRAIAHAIDRKFIVDKLLINQANRLDGPLHHTSPYFDESALHKYELDLDLANKLLDEAGMPRQAGGMRQTYTLDWIPDANVNSQEPVAQYLKPQLAKIGLDITLRPSPDFPTWAKRISNWEYDLSMNAIWNWPDPVIGVHRAYLCTNQKQGVIWSNTEGYCSETLDKIMANAGREPDFEKRKALYRQFQQITTDELPFTWTNEEPLYTLYDAKLDSLPLTVWGALAPFDEMHWKA